MPFCFPLLPAPVFPTSSLRHCLSVLRHHHWRRALQLLRAHSTSVVCKPQDWTLGPGLRGGRIGPEAGSLDPNAKHPLWRPRALRRASLDPAKERRPSPFKRRMVLSNMVATSGYMHLNLNLIKLNITKYSVPWPH